MSSPLGTAADASDASTAAPAPAVKGDEDAHIFDEPQIYTEDFVVIIVYFLSVLTVGIWVRIEDVFFYI